MRIAYYTALTYLTVASLLGNAAPAQAQSAGSEAFPYILVTTDDIKPGGFNDYQRLQQERAKVLKAVNWKRVSIGFTHRFGPALKVYHYSFYRTLDELDQDQKQLAGASSDTRRELQKIADDEANVLIGRNVGMTRYHPDISYQGDFNWADFRLMSVINIQLKAGMHDTYKINRTITLEGKKATKAPYNLAIYANFAGMQSWQYFIIRPVAGLKSFDAIESFIHNDSYAQKFGAENKKKMLEAFAQSVASEHEWYLSFDPTLSYTTKEWAGANADFWKP